MNQTAEMLNALVDQKDAILNMVARATDADELRRAYDLLTFAAPVWDAAEYGYKVGEVKAQIVRRAEHLVVVERSDLGQYRRGTRLHNFTLSGIRGLEMLRDEVKGGVESEAPAVA